MGGIQGNEELWAEYIIGALFIIVRFGARWKVVGIRNFQLEDLFMGIALATYTAIVVIIHLITQYGAIIGQTPESVYLLPDSMVQSFIIGQKLMWADWVIYLFYAWSLKSTLLTMFYRLSRGLGWQAMAVKVVMGYTAVAFVGSFLTHIFICVPVHKSWQIQPYPGEECAVRNTNYKAIATFNASSDFAIVLLPLPIIFAAKIPIWRRISLMFLLCSGCFVAVAAILRAYYSLQDLSLLPVAAGWTSRELFVGAIVVSIPGIKPLFSKTRWFSKSSNEKYGGSGDPSSNNNNPNKTPSKGSRNWNELVTIGGTSHGGNGGIETGVKGHSEWRVGAKEIKGHQLPSDGGSEEFILEGNGRRNNMHHDNSINGDKSSSDHDVSAPRKPSETAIHVTSSYEVRHGR